MSWYSRTWAACTWRGCEAEVLRTKAEAAGWYAKTEGGWLCPIHKPGRVGFDVHSRAAGEREDDE